MPFSFKQNQQQQQQRWVNQYKRQFRVPSESVKESIDHLARATEHLGSKASVERMRCYLDQPQVSLQPIEHLPSTLVPLTPKEKKRREQGGQILAVDCENQEWVYKKKPKDSSKVPEIGNENWG